MRKLPWAGSAALALGALLAYGGPAIFKLGFYHDDWWFLSVMRFGPEGFGGRVSALLADGGTLYLRPLDAPLWSALYGLFGLSPLGWQAATLLVALATAVGTERLLRVYGATPRVALLGSLAALAYPTKDAALFWPLANVVPASFACFVWATVLHVSWVQTGCRRSLAGTSALLLASLGFYDQVFFQFLAWASPPTSTDPAARRRMFQGMAAAAAVTAFFAFYKLYLVRVLFGVSFNKALILSPMNALVVALRSLETSFGWRMMLAAASAAFEALLFSPLTALAALALPWAVRHWGEGGDEAPAGSARRLAIFGAALFVLGYLPIMVSDYRPSPFTHMNRINYAPALGLVAAAVALALEGGRRTHWETAGTAFCALFLTAHVGFAAYWAQSWDLQERARRVVQEKLADWPAGTTLLFKQPTLMVGNRAPLFLASWDATGAVKLWTGDASREADALRPGVRFVPEGVAVSERVYRFSESRILDVMGGAIVQVPRPKQD